MLKKQRILSEQGLDCEKRKPFNQPYIHTRNENMKFNLKPYTGSQQIRYIKTNFETLNFENDEANVLAKECSLMAPVPYRSAQHMIRIIFKTGPRDLRAKTVGEKDLNSSWNMNQLMTYQVCNGLFQNPYPFYLNKIEVKTEKKVPYLQG